MAASAPSLPPVSVVGFGAVTPIGRTPGEIIAALLESPTAAAGPRRVSDALFSDPAIAKSMRRAERYARMAATAAVDAWAMAATAINPAAVPPERVGLIVSSGFGPHPRGFRFLDGLLDNGDAAASPTDFSHSVHGAASAYITGMLNVQGPSFNVTDFECGFEEAVRLAQSWLANGTADRVLVGAAEELGDVMLHCVAQANAVRSTRIVPGEGSVFLLLAPQAANGIATISTTGRTTPADVITADDPHLWPMEFPAPPSAVNVTNSFGHSPSAAAFQTLAGLLMLRSQRPLGCRAAALSLGPIRRVRTHGATELSLLIERT